MFTSHTDAQCYKLPFVCLLPETSFYSSLCVNDESLIVFLK